MGSKQRVSAELGHLLMALVNEKYYEAVLLVRVQGWVL